MSRLYAKFLLLLLASYASCKPPQQPEIVHWQQPVCLAPGLNATLCSITDLQRHRISEYDDSVEQSSSEERFLTTNKTLISKQVRDAIAIEQIEPSSFAGEKLRERETPALEDDNIRVRSFYVDSSLQEIEEKVQTLIQVTKIVRSPTTATLVAQNCVLDVSVPLCEGYESRLADIDRPMRVQLQLSANVTESAKSVVDELPVAIVSRSIVAENEVGEKNNVTLKEAIANVAQRLINMRRQIIDAVVEDYGAEREFVVQTLEEIMQRNGERFGARKNESVWRSVAEKKMDSVPDFVEKKPNFVEATIKTKQDIAAAAGVQIQAAVEQQIQAAQALVNKGRELIGSSNKQMIDSVVESAKSVVNDFLEAKNSFNLQLASREQEAVQNITEKSISAIKDVADAVHVAVQQIADTKVQISKAVSEKMQEMISTASLVTPFLISTIQQNYGLNEKEATAAAETWGQADLANFGIDEEYGSTTTETVANGEELDRVEEDVEESSSGSGEHLSDNGQHSEEKKPVEVSPDLDGNTKSLPTPTSTESSDEASTTEAEETSSDTSTDQSTTERSENNASSAPIIASDKAEGEFNISFDPLVFSNFRVLPLNTDSKLMSNYDNNSTLLKQTMMDTTAAPSTTPATQSLEVEQPVKNEPTALVTQPVYYQQSLPIVASEPVVEPIQEITVYQTYGIPISIGDLADDAAVVGDTNVKVDDKTTDAEMADDGTKVEAEKKADDAVEKTTAVRVVDVQAKVETTPVSLGEVKKSDEARTPARK